MTHLSTHTHTHTNYRNALNHTHTPTKGVPHMQKPEVCMLSMYFNV